MRIFITGGAGYLGSILVPILLLKGYQVTVIDNFMYNQSSLLDCCYDENLTIVRGDARNEILVEEYLKKADIIIPLAAIVGAPACDRNSINAITTNLNAIKFLLNMKSHNQWLIFPTTNSGYGVGQDGIYCTEETPLNPISLYGRLKVSAEKAVLSEKNTIALRLATVFGISPRMRLDLLVNDMVYRAVTDGFVVLYEPNFKRNYIHISDIAKAFIHCINHFDSMKNDVYNVGISEANLSKRELCEEIKKQVPNFYFIEANIGEDKDKRNYIVSNAKIEATGFKPDVSLQEGIAELIKGYQIIRRNQYSNV